MIIYTVIV